MVKEQKKVLVVDDEPTILKLARVKLEKEGFSVIDARNGAEAIEKAKSEKPDVIIMDIMMPKMNGNEACKNIKEDPETHDIPVLMLTAVGQFEEQLKSLEDSGATDYITKPFDPVELAEQVNRILTNQGKEDAVRAKNRKVTKLRTMLEIMQKRSQD